MFKRAREVFNLESYIIHIYRRDEKDPDSVSGLVEGPDFKRPAVFMNARELFEILTKSHATGENPALKKGGQAGKRKEKPL